MNQDTSKILVIGKPGTSKTTFLAQLFNVIQTGRSQFRLPDGMPTNIRSINEARRQLDNGESVQSTHAEENNVLQLKLSDGKVVLELEFPDYGGEQVRDIIRDRSLKGPWVSMCKNSDTWLLFIRLHDHAESLDVLSKSIDEVEPASFKIASDSDIHQVNEAVEFVELLQSLLYVRGKGIQKSISTPKLRVVITLWDEINTTNLPCEVLLQKLPLLSHYAHSNWAENSVEVWGLSAQGFRLDTKENKEKYDDYGPAKYAYVVQPSGEQTNDLSLIFV